MLVNINITGLFCIYIQCPTRTGGFGVGNQDKKIFYLPSVKILDLFEPGVEFTELIGAAESSDLLLPPTILVLVDLLQAVGAVSVPGQVQ